MIYNPISSFNNNNNSRGHLLNLDPSFSNIIWFSINDIGHPEKVPKGSVPMRPPIVKAFLACWLRRCMCVLSKAVSILLAKLLRRRPPEQSITCTEKQDWKWPKIWPDNKTSLAVLIIFATAPPLLSVWVRIQRCILGRRLLACGLFRGHDTVRGRGGQCSRLLQQYSKWHCPAYSIINTVSYN